MSFTNLSGGDFGAMSDGYVSSLISIGGTLYAAGATYTGIPFVVSYDSTNHKWKNLSGGDVETMSSWEPWTLISIEGTLYMGGQRYDGSQPPFVMSYDNTNNIWKNLSGGDLDAIINGWVYSFAVIGYTLYMGGFSFSDNSYYPFIRSYDISSQVWTNLLSGVEFETQDIQLSSMTAIGNILYVAMEENVMSYDSTNHIWKNLYLYGIPSAYITTLTSIGNTLYAGGYSQMIHMPAFVVSYDSSNTIWKNLSGGDFGTMSVGYVSSLISIGDTLYVGCRRYVGSNNQPFVMSYDSSNTIWKNLSGGDFGEIHSGDIWSLTSMGGTLYVGGERKNGSSSLPFVMSYSLSSSVVPVDTHIPCFLANAPVLTPTGYTKMSALAEGDTVLTGDGRVVAIQRVLHTHVAAGPSVNPYVIPKGTFGATARLLISPNHRVSTEQGFVEARLLGLQQEEMTGEIEYYNLELPSWSQDTMVVAGVVVESLAPVRRATMTLGEFKKALVAQYGELTPAVLAKVQKTCRLLAGGRVECPVLPT